MSTGNDIGTVYLAHDTFLDRSVAIKELTVTVQTGEVAFDRFPQEARAAGGLNHPHVVTVHALKVVEPNVYLVMEYLAGGSLPITSSPCAANSPRSLLAVRLETPNNA